MTTAFVILAAGRGSRLGRVGDHLHKALVPLAGKAVISHIIESRPPDSEVIICTGYKASQVQAYVTAAHPDLEPRYIHVAGWNTEQGGPGLSLLSAEQAVGERDMVFTSCDTIWDEGGELFLPCDRSWAAVAPIPPGTPEARWCRMVVDDQRVIAIMDKLPGVSGVPAYTGLGSIRAVDLRAFWRGVAQGATVAGERQVTGGFEVLVADDRLDARHITWTDIGDEEAYRSAVALVSGYDWTKLGQATYVLPETGQVVKYSDDPATMTQRHERSKRIGSAVPDAKIDDTGCFLQMRYIPGRTGYQQAEIEGEQLASSVCKWAAEAFPDATPSQAVAESVAMRFYRDKTLERILLLTRGLRHYAIDVVSRINWEALCDGVQPAYFHGDLNYGNIIVDEDGELHGIDWRENFAGATWGDRRYDWAKLLAGCFVHWDNARCGDFRPWEDGLAHAETIRQSVYYTPELEILGALSLINSAPLHASPLDEILIARGCAWLSEAL